MRFSQVVTKIVVILFLQDLDLVFVMDYQDTESPEIKSISRNDLYLLMEGRTVDQKLDFVENKILSSYKDDDKKASAKRTFSMFRHHFKKKWLAAQKTKAIFEKNNSEWLKGIIFLPGNSSEGDEGVSLPDKIGSTPGRPQKTFLESSERTKRRRTECLRSNELDELTYATQMKLRESGKSDASKVVKDLQVSPTRAKKYKEAYKRNSQTPPRALQLSIVNALLMIVNAGLSRSQYEIVRATNKSFYPCYSLLQKAKKEILPFLEGYRVTEISAEIILQYLINNTATRLLMHLGDSIKDLNEEDKKTLLLISKWGCDGSQQTQFKMTFQSDSDSDANIFQSSMVPLQLICEKDKKIIWQNPTPSSPRYCRPIRMRFIHETTDVTNEEIAYINSQIKNLERTIFQGIEVKHKMLFTMIDGKVCNAATHTKSSMRCYLCDATSKEFNDLTKTRPIKKENLNFGLSLLHARIRFFENLLHIAYKLPVQKWNKRLSPEEENLVKLKKADIQARFKTELGLLVDMPKANFGNTNDGNTSRRFFENYEKSANITGLDKDLIYRLKIILDVLCSGLKIDAEKFDLYARETERRYVEFYSFYPQSPTMHKILRHGAAVIGKSILPIGQLSEEAAKARNKHIREYRLHHSRKYSREACNMDVLNRLLLTSDPLLSGMRKLSKKKIKTYDIDVLNLLLPDDSFNYSIDSNDEDDV